MQTDKLLFLSHIRVSVLRDGAVVVDWLLFVTPIVEFCVCLYSVANCFVIHLGGELVGLVDLLCLPGVL